MDIGIKLVAGAIKREGYFEDVEAKIHNADVYFIIHDLGVKLGAYKVPKSRFDTKDAASLGFLVIGLVDGPMMSMFDLDAAFAAPLPFDS